MNELYRELAATCRLCGTAVLKEHLNKSGFCANSQTCNRLADARDKAEKSSYATFSLTSEEVGNLMFLCGYAIANMQTEKHMSDGIKYPMTLFVESLRRRMQWLGDNQ